MNWDERGRERLEIALTEADVLGVRSLDDASVALLLDISALPAIGPIDQDPRRKLVFHGVSELRILLRSVTVDGNGPAIPLRDLDAVEDFFESLAIGGSMYGWRYFDDPELTQDWPTTPSLVVPMSATSPPHTFYWFNECSRVVNGDLRSYCIEGTVVFTDLTMQRADGTDQAVDDFADEGVRWWQAFNDHDARVSVEAQQAWAAARSSWRRWPGLPTTLTQ